MTMVSRQIETEVGMDVLLDGFSADKKVGMDVLLDGFSADRNVGMDVFLDGFSADRNVGMDVLLHLSLQLYKRRGTILSNADEWRAPFSTFARDGLGWLNLFNTELSLNTYCGDQDPRRWGKRETIPNATLSPTE